MSKILESQGKTEKDCFFERPETAFFRHDGKEELIFTGAGIDKSKVGVDKSQHRQDSVNKDRKRMDWYGKGIDETGCQQQKGIP